MSTESDRRWYVVHAYSGFELQVEKLLKERIKRSGLEESFGDILVPTEEVVEMRDGQRRRSDRKFFPGYVLVNMEMNDDTWHLVKSVPKVMGFIGGSSDRPAPISSVGTRTSPKLSSSPLRAMRSLSIFITCASKPE